MHFKCKGCGDCCRNFGEKGKCIPLFDFEVERLKEIAARKNIKIEFKPRKYLLEENSGIIFVYLYGLNHNVCPFLKEKKCSIYQERPIICRQFPILWTARFHKGDDFGASCLSECTYFDCKKEFEKRFFERAEISDWEIDFYLKETYGDCFEWALKGNIIGKKILEIIKKHDGLGDFKLKEISEGELKEYRVLSFGDFLKLKGFEEDLEEVYREKCPNINFKKHSL
jgi:Fe-S-cluster containining protein